MQTRNRLTDHSKQLHDDQRGNREEGQIRNLVLTYIHTYTTDVENNLMVTKGEKGERINWEIEIDMGN